MDMGSPENIDSQDDKLAQNGEDCATKGSHLGKLPEGCGSFSFLQG